MADKVVWIVTEGNDPDVCGDGEFGVEVNGIPYLYYKWPDATPSDGSTCPLTGVQFAKVKYRPIYKREFGDVIRRLNDDER